MNIKPRLPKDVEFILETLNKNGYEGYIVGGCVRDSIMGIEPHDWDITTSATPLEVKEIFSHTVDTGIKHGTVTVVLNKENYEITTYRVEGNYTDYRHPSSVNFTRNLHEDLLRRDFTVNAIAYEPKEGYTDIFGGIEDIDKKVIKGVGDASQRFNEDALRMLRAVRFSVQLDFDIEKETLNALKENVHLIKHVSVERIREELTKTLLGNYTDRLDILWSSEILKPIYPSMHKYCDEQIQKIKHQLKSLTKEVSWRYCVLLQYLTDDDYEKIVSSLKFDTKTKRTILSILRNLEIPLLATEVHVRRQARKLGIECLEGVYEIRRAKGEALAEECLMLLKKIVSENQSISIKQLVISGGDLEALGFQRGTKIGQALEYALELVIENQTLNEKEILINKIKNKFLE